MLLLVDSYDSFTFNLVQAFLRIGAELDVVRNDADDAEGLLARQPTALVLSPGPGRPEDAGVLLELLARAPPDLPILGVCLGHEALVLHHGGEIERDPVPVHGRAARVHHRGDGLFAGLPNPLAAGRYHSLRARRETLPAELGVTGWTDDGLVMAVEHRELPRSGIQFHPESILTPDGERLLANFLARGAPRAEPAR